MMVVQNQNLLSYLLLHICQKTRRGNLLRTGAEKSSLHIKSHHNCSFGQKHGFLRFGLLFLLGISNVYSSFLPTFIYLKCVHKCYLKPKRVELGNKLTSLKKTSVKLVSQVAPRCCHIINALFAISL